MIRIAIAEDIERLYLALKTKIELDPGLQIVDWSKNGSEIVHKIQKGLEFDMVLMDIQMPVMDGIEATKFILSKYPNTKILICTVFDDEKNLFEATMAGAKGYILKDESPEKMHRSVYETMEGGSAMSPSIALKALNLIKNGRPMDAAKNPEANLTKREQEIMELLATGLSYDFVGDNLGISYGTVRKHIENIYRKLGVHNKIEALKKIHD
ncbi:MAG: response regulator transcription factor [Bacteroidia bacterium]|nr:response regulator transcription factor [Bacteroidia bacterium]